MSTIGPDSVAMQTVRLGEKRLTALLDELDSASEPNETELSGESFSYRHSSIVIGLIQPGSATAQLFYVQTRCMSATGIAFLHGGYVHADTTCSFQLLTLRDTFTLIRGTVADCRYAGSSLHEVIATFEHPVDLALYCTRASQCRVLVVDDDPSAIRIATHYLIHLNAKVESACNGAEALEMAGKTEYDLILMDISMPVLDGIGALKALREKGYSRPVVAFTASTSADELTQYLALGFESHVPKPFTKEDISRVLDGIREDPILCTLSDDDGLVGLVQDFVKDLPNAASRLDGALAGSEPEELRAAVQQLKENGGTYGFAPITEAAVAAERGIDEGSPELPVRHLIKTLRRVRTRT